jgi:lipoate-protein ligase A
VLEARVEEVSQFEEKITILNDELNKNKVVHEDFRKKMILEISKTNAEAAKTKSELQKHMDEYKSTFINNEFYMDKSNG